MATACVRVSIEAEEASNATPIEVSAVRAKGVDLAVTAIDFDPPLRSDGSFATSETSLLVAVENRGDKRADSAVVRVSLSDPTDGAEMLSRSASVSKIVPGESRIIRFTGISGLPLRSSYTLRVALSPSGADEITNNNLRTFNVRVEQMSRQDSLEQKL